jgi:tetratricopeptide (TPR) repeat protein
MIQKYKEGKLSDAEMAQVEADLMAQMFRRQEDNKVRDSLKKWAALAAQDDLTETARVESTRMTVVHSKNRSWTWLAAAASVAVLVVASWWFFSKPNTSESNTVLALADTYLKSDAAPIWSTTMDNTTIVQREEKAKDAYRNGAYDDACSLFEALPPTKKEHYFYLGIAALKQQKPDAAKAVEHLLKARTLANGWQEDATNWYLALAYIRMGKTEAAQIELNNIVKIGRDNVRRAEALLKKMAE